ncbi:MAG: alanine--tRNA ligase, partial [Actinomycetota bacterium]|nr:alanine--tRNA ligase [Actinomycetota bacterium]
MQSPEIRETFLDFFRARDHRVWPSSSLIPNDPTIFLTVAGMVQFKPYFLGEATPEHPRAASDQKCVRIRGKLDDIDIVGTTTRHLTFFEMLGNFSFGDYFKRRAIAWAWELSTSGFGFEPERIWATIHEDDDEAEALWLSETDVPAERIVRRGREDNFWTMGGAGPCGPCSELYYDRGPEHGPDGGPEVDETRFVEFWNLVFMQYSQDEDGTILGELPRRNVDTGLGMERLAMLLQDVPNVYETDVLRPMLDRASDVTGVAYGDDPDRDVSLRVIADHARSAAFLIGDGVLPSNEARGYVLRRLLRRIVRHARMVGGDRRVMRPMLEAVIASLGDAWPDLRRQSELITRVGVAEEDAFQRTLRTGTVMLDQAVAEARQAGRGTLSGETAFTLHDTYGFPVDLTVEIAREQGLELDRDEFERHMQAQRARARAAGRDGGPGGVPAQVYREARGHTGRVEFVGYESETASTRLGAIITPSGLVRSAQEGDEVQVVLPRTPFFAEGGGQLGDHGTIETASGRLAVGDTTSPAEGLVVHSARVGAGEVQAGQEAHAEIDHLRRASIRRGHTATHILHATLQEVLGEHAVQAGSAIDAGRFRFDFPHFESVGRDQLAEVEERVNARVAGDPQVRTFETSQEEARRLGAVALFGEHYGERVRVVDIGEFSRELCGGTHVGHAGEVGLFTILSEGSVAANLRRIEAATGPEAFTRLSRERLVAEQVARLLKVSTGDVVDRVAGLLERLRVAERELARARHQTLTASAGRLLADAEQLDGVTLLAAPVEGADRDGLRALAADLRNRVASGVVVLGGTTADGKAQLVA